MPSSAARRGVPGVAGALMVASMVVAAEGELAEPVATAEVAGVAEGVGRVAWLKAVEMAE